MPRTLFSLFIALLVSILLVVLQVWLCKKSTKLGLILPAVSLVRSLPTILTLATLALNHVCAGFQKILAVAAICLALNIRTIILGGIWLHYKGRRDKLNDLKRMQIEDLE